jgi:pyruvate/2-oxoglutarate dehydrogenase complex dihydrolipoamide acyltransferase (E2) component
LKEFKLPDLGEGVHEGQVVRISVKEGDSIREDDPLMEVETDKAAVEIPSPYTGTVTRVHVQEQQMVNVGDVMVTFEGGADAPAPAPEKKAAAAVVATATIPPPVRPATSRKRASPAVRKLARQRGIDLESIDGSGPGGRVTRQDVERAATLPAPAPPAAAPPRPALSPLVAPAPPTAAIVEPPGVEGTDQYGAIRRHPLTQTRKTIARTMTQSWSTIPHVTDCHDADITQLDKLRKGYDSEDRPGRKLTTLVFVIRAVVRALQRTPVFNASFDEAANEIVYRRYVNIAIGVHTERGLIAPVVRDADRMSIPQISDALAVIAENARSATFAVNDTRGGTYTISNPGALGSSRYSTPLITPPQVAVLGLGRARWEARVVDGEVTPRLVLPMSHSFDHRLIDGGDELAFMNHLVADLENPARLLL